MQDWDTEVCRKGAKGLIKSLSSLDKKLHDTDSFQSYWSSNITCTNKEKENMLGLQSYLKWVWLCPGCLSLHAESSWKNESPVEKENQKGLLTQRLSHSSGVIEAGSALQIYSFVHDLFLL